MSIKNIKIRIREKSKKLDGREKLSGSKLMKKVEDCGIQLHAPRLQSTFELRGGKSKVKERIGELFFGWSCAFLIFKLRSMERKKKKAKSAECFVSGPLFSRK